MLASVAICSVVLEPDAGIVLLGLQEAVARIVHGVDPDLPVYGVRTMREMMGTSLARRRFSLSLMAVFGALALFLASTGIYGVMAYAVSQRAQEFSIRMALGADARDILLLALRPGAILTLTREWCWG